MWTHLQSRRASATMNGNEGGDENSPPPPFPPLWCHFQMEGDAFVTAMAPCDIKALSVRTHTRAHAHVSRRHTHIQTHEHEQHYRCRKPSAHQLALRPHDSNDENEKPQSLTKLNFTKINCWFTIINEKKTCLLQRDVTRASSSLQEIAGDLFFEIQLNSIRRCFLAYPFFS